MAPHGCYPARGEDRWIAIAISPDQEWNTLCEIMGNPEWSKDEKFSNGPSRWKNQDELNKYIGAWTKKHTAEEVFRSLQEKGIAAGPSHRIDELFIDPHLKDRKFFVDPEHPEVGKRPLPGLPWKTSGISPHIEHAPLLGEHNEYVFCELLGLSLEEFAELVGDSIII